MKANDRQVAGIHYQKQKIQHWDYVAANDLDYFQGQITKYVSRWKDKNGLDDLRKAQHFLEKYIEVEEGRRSVGEVLREDHVRMPCPHCRKDIPEGARCSCLEKRLPCPECDALPPAHTFACPTQLNGKTVHPEEDGR